MEEQSGCHWSWSIFFPLFRFLCFLPMNSSLYSQYSVYMKRWSVFYCICGFYVTRLCFLLSYTVTSTGREWCFAPDLEFTLFLGGVHTCRWKMNHNRWVCSSFCCLQYGLFHYTLCLQMQRTRLFVDGWGFKRENQQRLLLGLFMVYLFWFISHATYSQFVRLDGWLFIYNLRRSLLAFLIFQSASILWLEWRSLLPEMVASLSLRIQFINTGT